MRSGSPEDRCDACIRYGTVMYGEFVLGRLADWPYRASTIFEPPSTVVTAHDNPDFEHHTDEQPQAIDGTEPVRGGPRLGFDVSRSDARRMRAWLTGHPIDAPKPVPLRFNVPAHFTAPPLPTTIAPATVAPPMPATGAPRPLPPRFQKGSRNWEPIKRRGTKNAR